MRTWLPAAALALTCAGGVWLLAPSDTGDAGPVAEVREAAAPPLRAPTPLDHVDDYSAPAEELVEHADHLDFDRLPADTRAQVEAELARRDAVAAGLWDAYGHLLPVTERPRSVDAYELAYLLVAARADQLSDAVHRAGSLEGARSLPGVGADHVEVRVALDGDCVTVAFAGDPYGRAFGARVAPAPDTALRGRLERRVRVDAVGAPACDGRPPAFSPAATALLGSG